MRFRFRPCLYEAAACSMSRPKAGRRRWPNNHAVPKAFIRAA